jgi:hypothetical protein
MKLDISQQAQILENIEVLKNDLKIDSEVTGQVTCERIIGALEQFSECARYLNTRRSAGTALDLNSEAGVQDMIYLMLRAWIQDITPETPTEKVANRYTIKDFLIKSALTVIEAKYIRDANHGKNISKELHDDIENYRHNPNCKDLVFFIYDPGSYIPDVSAIKRAIEEERAYSGKILHCHIVVP